MKTSFMILSEWIHLITLGAFLVLIGLPGRVVGQNVNIRIGPPSTEERDKAILNKLPADQAAAYLMCQRTWDTVPI
jgi:hypothetical protein